MRLYVGMDLHSTNCYAGILNEGSKKILSCKLPNDRARIISTLAPYKENIEGIAVESTYNWYWLVDALMEEGYQVHLANPAAMKQYQGIKYLDDRHDAFWLAEMLRLGILPEGYIYPKEERPIRDLLRKRGHLVKLRTSLILSYENNISHIFGRKLPVNDVKRLRKDHVTPLFEGKEDLALAGRVSKETIDFLTHQILQIEAVVEKRIQVKEP